MQTINALAVNKDFHQILKVIGIYYYANIDSCYLAFILDFKSLVVTFFELHQKRPVNWKVIQKKKIIWITQGCLNFHLGMFLWYWFVNKHVRWWTFKTSNYSVLFFWSQIIYKTLKGDSNTLKTKASFCIKQKLLNERGSSLGRSTTFFDVAGARLLRNSNYRVLTGPGFNVSSNTGAMTGPGPGQAGFP